MKTKNYVYVLYFVLFLIKVKAQYEIHLYFNSVGPQVLFCDDYAEFFDTEYMNIYKIGEDGSRININSFLRQEPSDYCFGSLIYDVTSVDEMIIIELLESPSELTDFFAESTVYKIMRFDYPFPDDGTDYSNMFYYNSELTYIDLSLFSFIDVKDMSSMFYNCSKLETIIFPTNENPNKVEKLSDMFSYSAKLTSIDLSQFSLVNAKDMGYMFKGCKQLKYVKFRENEKAEKIENMSDLFADCSSLTSIDLTYFNFKNLKKTQYMFNRCSNLTTIILPTDEKATSLQNCKSMFYGCSQLRSIDLSKFSFVNVGDLSSLFQNCANLETIIFPQDEIASNVQEFGHMFSGCEKLTTINLSNIDFKNARKLSYMFNGCTLLNNINLPTSAKANKVEYYQGMFLNCESITSIDLSNFSFTVAKDITSMFLYCSSLETLILPRDEVVTHIEDLSYMFAICLNLKSIDLSGISFVNVKDISYIFANCLSLETVIFPNDAEINNIENVAYAFANCQNLVSLDLSKFYFHKVEDFSYLFFSCISLENLKFSTKKINRVKNFDHAFYNCSKIQVIDLSDISMISVTNLSNTFSYSEQLKSIKFEINEINNDIIDMNNTFSNCKSITSLDLRFINVNGSISLNHTFSNCISLKELNIFNLNTKESQNTFNFLEDVTLDGCLYYSYDNTHPESSITNKYCQKYIGYHKCGPCINDNLEQYCSMDISGNIVPFHYIYTELEFPISERQCYWSKDFENVAGYTFINNENKSIISYYINYCDHYCDECSENRYGCTQCKNGLYPINIEYNDFLNDIKSYFFCYNKTEMKNYYFDGANQQLIKCEEKCSECLAGFDVCSECNYKEGYYKVEKQKNKCTKYPPGDNWVKDETAQEWRKCNDRCKKCNIQSKTETNHQCTECADNYYPYKTDYNNDMKGARKGLDCWTTEEVALENKNYFLNEDSLFEKCDDSCAVCQNIANNCSECQMNYYYINGHKNGSCFDQSLEGFVLDIVNGENVFVPCFHLCKHCREVSDNFLYQQCTECDEENYTLDIYSLNEAYCIPKRNNNSEFVKELPKWYIDCKDDNLAITN